MSKFVFRNGHWHDKATGEPLKVPTGRLALPMVTPTMPEYQSPIDGRPITTRHARREDLKRNDCVEFEPSMSPTQGKLKNKAFCKKRGLTLSPEYRD